jgi:hypothetical protein
VVDYRKLNAATVNNKFSMPIIGEFLDEILGASFFTKLDLNSGFHQIRMTEEDEFKTTFKTHHGHFQFRVMHFGLTNAPPCHFTMFDELCVCFFHEKVCLSIYG